MFSEWTDPFDIDNYYQDLDGLMRDIKAAPSSSVYYQPRTTAKVTATESKPTVVTQVEAPTAPIVNTTKNTFEVKPDSTFLDGHPVGRPPLFNILRSGPPKESYCDGNGTYYDGWDWATFVFYVFLVFLICSLVAAQLKISSLKAQVRTSDMTLKMLLMLQGNIKKVDSV